MMKLLNKKKQFLYDELIYTETFSAFHMLKFPAALTHKAIFIQNTSSVRCLLLFLKAPSAKYSADPQATSYSRSRIYRAGNPVYPLLFALPEAQISSTSAINPRLFARFKPT